ncbi:MAG: hypothetical protein BWK78_05720, partial [Thiotrichaceae bacterium IS1]
KDNSGIIWMTPVTSKTEKIQGIIEEKKKNGRNYEDLFHPLKIGRRESFLLIADMFPIVEEHIERAYTISGIPFKLLDEKQISQIDKKAKTILALLRKGIKFSPTQADILKIESDLKSRV